ncbi:hypothetical protein CP533_0705 [Ophiocordyceps camponoti-saundersi (nom. inval.)]|nr:hypothetical protein CP533_0705 [Ophiocordyceps camponoti-saundersi (nom. inval.)]
MRHQADDDDDEENDVPDLASLEHKVLCHVPAAINPKTPSCSRVSCSWGQAIFLCNKDTRMSFTASCLYPSHFARIVSDKSRFQGLWLSFVFSVRAASPIVNIG